MSKSIYLTLANLFINLDAKRVANAKKKSQQIDYSSLSPHLLKDIGLDNLSAQRHSEQAQVTDANPHGSIHYAIHRMKINT